MQTIDFRPHRRNKDASGNTNMKIDLEKDAATALAMIEKSATWQRFSGSVREARSGEPGITML
jgi:hypothetical protein